MPRVPLTPEHLQLYSDEKLRRAAQQGLPGDERPNLWKRLARLEMLRRTCSIPQRVGLPAPRPGGRKN